MVIAAARLYVRKLSEKPFPSIFKIKAITYPIATAMIDKIPHQTTPTMTLATTICPRETGSANKSVTVRSVYSRPNNQLNTKPNPINPPMPTKAVKFMTYSGQSARSGMG